MTRTELRITGMQCPRCAEVVHHAIVRVPGVTQASVDLDAGSATVTLADYGKIEEVISAIEEEGYEAKQIVKG